MSSFFRRNRSPVLTAVLAVAVSGITFAGISTAADEPTAKSSADINRAGNLNRNAVESRHIKNRQVKNVDLGSNSINTRNVAPDSLFGGDIKEETLGQVPNAKIADNATRAASADRANFATSAARATEAERLASETIVPRQTLPFTDLFPATRMDQGGNVVTLAEVGGLKLEGLCRVTNGNGQGQYQNEAEAKVMLWHDTSRLSWRGAVGPRENIPAGPIEYTALPNNNPEGEGNHMFLAASNENRDDRLFNGDPATTGGTPGYSSHVGVVNAEDGSAWVLSFYTGFQTLGVNQDCVYGGIVRQISGAA